MKTQTIDKAQELVTRWTRRLRTAQTKLKKAKAELRRAERKAAPKPVDPERRRQQLAALEKARAAKAGKTEPTIITRPSSPKPQRPTGKTGDLFADHPTPTPANFPNRKGTTVSDLMRHNPDLDAMFG